MKRTVDYQCDNTIDVFNNSPTTHIVHYIHTSGEKEADEVEIKVERNKLGRSNVVKCLGVLLDDKLKFAEHVKAIKR